eukprot:1160017-Pelagomonas_calceolata.AAC.2
MDPCTLLLLLLHALAVIQTTWSLDGLDDTDAHDESHTLGCSSMPWEHDSKMLMSKKIYIAFSQHASAKASHRCI